jgi:hypothetical protein
MNRRALRLVLAAAILVAGCRRPEGRASSPAPASLPIAAGRLLPAMRFQPPADGLLTDDQIDRFLRVRRAAKGRTDLEAARALGIPSEEISWTRARVVENRRVKESSADVYTRAVATLKEARQITRDPERARTLEEQIANLERMSAELRRAETRPPALAGNMRRVAPRRAEIEALAP